MSATNYQLHELQQWLSCQQQTINCMNYKYQFECSHHSQPAGQGYSKEAQAIREGQRRRAHLHVERHSINSKGQRKKQATSPIVTKSSICFEAPKSASLTRPALSTRMLAPLMSRCMMWFLCRYSSPSRIWRQYTLTIVSLKAPAHTDRVILSNLHFLGKMSVEHQCLSVAAIVTVCNVDYVQLCQANIWWQFAGTTVG